MYARSDELESVSPAGLRAIAMRLGKAFRTPRTKAECRELMAWIQATEANQPPIAAGACADCGEPGERTGHMGCQFPGYTESRR